MILGDAIGFDLVAVTTGDGQEQQRRQNRQQPGTFIEPAPESAPGFFNRMTYHDTKLDGRLMKIQVYSDRMSYFKIVAADACRVVALGAKTGEEAHSEGKMKKEECRMQE